MNFTDSVVSMLCLPPWHSLFFQGIHGTGKSAAAALAAKIMDGFLIDRRLSQDDVGDLKGMPHFVQGRTIHGMPDWYPLRKEDADDLAKLLGIDKVYTNNQGDIGILFLDELDRAGHEVQQAVFEIALDRRLNLRPLSEGCKVISCVNGDDDIYEVLPFDPAFLDRWVVFQFKPTAEEWFNHAEGKPHPLEALNVQDVFTMDFFRKMEADYRGKVHDSVLQFLKIHSDLLDPTKQLIEDNPNQKLHSRRSWVRFSEYLHYQAAVREKGVTDVDVLAKDTASSARLIELASAYVGKYAAAKFQSFVRTDYGALNADVILNKLGQKELDRIKELVKGNASPELAAYGTMICSHLNDNNIEELNDTQSQNLLEFLRVLPRENRGSIWKELSQKASTPTKNWYRGKLRSDIAEILKDAMANPNARKAA